MNGSEDGHSTAYEIQILVSNIHLNLNHTLTRFGGGNDIHALCMFSLPSLDILSFTRLSILLFHLRMTKEWPPPTPKEQVASFLSFIELPKDLQDASPSLALLRELHICTICAFPYENLSLHYNPSHSIDLDPQSLFTKVITNNRGRGGYCMEIALMYNHIPWALGFDVYTASVRTRPRIHGVPQGDYPGWYHPPTQYASSD